MVTQSGNGDFTWRKNLTRKKEDEETELKCLNYDGSKKSGAMRGSSDSPCLRCLAGVPCVSLLAWILMFMGLCGWTVCTLLGVSRSRAILDFEEFLPFTEYAVIGVTVTTFVLCTVFLIVAAISSGSNSRDIFVSSKRNAIGRAFNILMIILGYISNVTWVLLCCLMMLPLAAFALLHYLADIKSVDCIDLMNYGYHESKKYCSSGLTSFWNDMKGISVYYLTAFLSGFIIVLSLVQFLIAMGANYKHLKETRLTTFNAYKHAEVRGSTGSILDTKM